MKEMKASFKSKRDTPNFSYVDGSWVGKEDISSWAPTITGYSVFLCLSLRRFLASFSALVQFI